MASKISHKVPTTMLRLDETTWIKYCRCGLIPILEVSAPYTKANMPMVTIDMRQKHDK